MRLFGKVDSQINRFDRAQYLTGPFDMAFELTTLVKGPIGLNAAQAYVPGLRAGSVYSPGAQVGQVYVPGMRAGEVL